MSIRNPEWLNQNTTRNYPLHSSATRRSGKVKFPNTLFADAVLVGTNPSIRYRISYIETIPAYIQVGISDDTGQFHGVFNVAKTNTDAFALAVFQPEVGSPLNGKLIFGPGRHNLEFVNRTYFGFDQAELEPSICIPNATSSIGVLSLSKYGSLDPTKRLQGHVQFVEGQGIRIDIDKALNTVKFSVNKEWNCDCPEDFNRIHPCDKAIKTINGVPPREDGNIDILQGNWMYVVPHPSEHRIEIGFVGDVDCCCDACAGLEDLKNSLATLVAGLST